LALWFEVRDEVYHRVGKERYPIEMLYVTMKPPCRVRSRR
jgi:hypothetical protein